MCATGTFRSLRASARRTSMVAIMCEARRAVERTFGADAAVDRRGHTQEEDGQPLCRSG